VVQEPEKTTAILKVDASKLSGRTGGNQALKAC
jgi:hypothetical protein